jgi:sigma-54 specific flagellar transcriptional regulator A
MTQTQTELDKYNKMKVLVLDDDRLSSHNLSIQLRFVGETPLVSTSENWQQALRTLTERGEDNDLLAIALGNIRHADLNELLLNLHMQRPQLPLLLLNQQASGQLPASLQARMLTLGDGALNYQSLLAALKSARQLAGRESEVLPSRIISETGTAMFRSLSGQSAVIQQVRQLLQQVAQTQATVLVTGESGTGKEIVARNLHYHSGRGDCPFIVVNCAAIAHDRGGVELFGQQKGYNGARDHLPGLVEKAGGGTLFFDDIAELPLNIQALLLRFLEDRHFQRVGGHEQLATDVRVVAATRQNLEKKITTDKFREDLYYRLSVVPIALPPLRDRLEDIPDLVGELISRLENHDQTSVRFNSAAIQSLQSHHWPGNVRELANLVERLGIMQPNAVIGVSDLPVEYQYQVAVQGQDEAATDIRSDAFSVDLAGADAARPLAEALANPPDMAVMQPLDESRLLQYLDKSERQLLAVALDDSAGIVGFAAERLQMDSAALRSKMQQHGIADPALKQ